MATPIYPSIPNITVYLEEIANLERSGDHFYVFRGQAKFDWPFSAAIMRPNTKRLLTYERDAIKEIISVHPSEFLNDETMFDRLVRAQHYGLPTRLVDVSINPLVALYFATEEFEGADGRIFTANVPPSRRKYYDSDAVSCVANLANMSAEEKDQIAALDFNDRKKFNDAGSIDRLIQFVRAEKPYFRTNIDPVDMYKPHHVTPKLSNKRIIAQTGSFIIFGLEGSGPTYARDIKLDSMRVPADAKGPIREELHTLGIHEASLFPEIERAAGYIKRKYS